MQSNAKKWIDTFSICPHGQKNAEHTRSIQINSLKRWRFKNDVRSTIDLMVLNHAEGFFGTTLIHATREAFLNVPECS